MKIITFFDGKRLRLEILGRTINLKSKNETMPESSDSTLKFALCELPE